MLHHIKTSQLICTLNRLIGFNMMPFFAPRICEDNSPDDIFFFSFLWEKTNNMSKNCWVKVYVCEEFCSVLSSINYLYRVGFDKLVGKCANESFCNFLKLLVVTKSTKFISLYTIRYLFFFFLKAELYCQNIFR